MRHEICKNIADKAVAALIEEVELTPKPGLVDRRNNGSHLDLNLTLMRESAACLHDTFYQMAELHYDKQPTVKLREQFGKIGRQGEQRMFAVTDNINTHKGAIWSVGLLCAAIARRKGNISFPQVLDDAAELARLPDRLIPEQPTNGGNVKKKYGLPGAREEAQTGFPHIRHVSYPAYEKARSMYSPQTAKLMALIALVSSLNDTCIAHRGGLEALSFARNEAKKTLQNFSIETLIHLDETFIKRWISPGGSADLLAATLFIAHWMSNYQRGVLYGEVDLYISGKSTYTT